jgi:hypothetical protein
VSAVIVITLVKGPSSSPSVTFDLTAHSEDPQILVSGNIDPKTVVTITAEPQRQGTINHLTSSDSNGQFQAELPVPRATEYTIRVSWSANEQRFTVEKKIKP